MPRRSPLVFLASALLHLMVVLFLVWTASTVVAPKSLHHTSILLVGPVLKKHQPPLKPRRAVRGPSRLENARIQPQAIPVFQPSDRRFTAPPQPILAASVRPPAMETKAPLPPAIKPVPPASLDSAALPVPRQELPPRIRMPQPAGFGDSRLSAGVKGPRPGSISQGEFGPGASSSTLVRRGAPPTAGGFGDILSAAPPVARIPPTPVTSVLSAVEILHKPRPAYTPEALKLQIEGEVVLNVIFAASGEVEEVRVLRGLGHGLDESAAAAARGIRFRPASRGGKPVDTAGVVHIKFELAY